MRNWILSCFLQSVLVVSAHAGMNDDPVLAMLKVDRLEWQERGGFNVEADAWLGKDTDKLWLVLAWEKQQHEPGEGEVQLLYRHAFSAFWDARIGVATALDGADNDNVEHNSIENERLVFAVEGLAPYWFELDMSLLLDKDARMEWRLEAEYELLLTQRLIASTMLELSAHSGYSQASHVANGLAEIEAGFNLRYEIRPEIAPYTGVFWKKEYLENSSQVDGWRWVLGLRFWY